MLKHFTRLSIRFFLHHFVPFNRTEYWMSPSYSKLNDTGRTLSVGMGKLCIGSIRINRISFFDSFVLFLPPRDSCLLSIEIEMLPTQQSLVPSSLFEHFFLYFSVAILFSARVFFLLRFYHSHHYLHLPVVIRWRTEKSIEGTNDCIESLGI